MDIKNPHEPGPQAGYHEKNFSKLKQGKLWEYIASRSITFFFGITLGFLFIRDAAYAHSEAGVPQSIIFVGGIIFFMNGLRKMMWGLVKMNDAAWDSTEVERPHQRHETFWQRFFLRLPIGQRRHLINRQSLAGEGLACVILIAYAISLGINDHLFVLSSEFPFVLNHALFSWSGWQFPENLWEGLVISSVAVIMSYINNSLFLTKIPQVRRVLTETLKGLPYVERLAFFFPLQLFNAVKGMREGATRGNYDEQSAHDVATSILSEYPEEVVSTSHKEKLLPLLVGEIRRDANPTSVFKFFIAQLALLKRGN